MMKKVLLFSPNGYVGRFMKERLTKEKDIRFYEMTRNSNFESEQMDYDILIYSASVTSARNETAGKYIQDNVVAAVSVIDFCKKYHVKKIIYLSSDEIYGALNTDRVSSDQTVMVDPNIYAVTKYLAERIIIESGIPHFILRMPGIVGRQWGKNFIYSLIDKIKNSSPVDLYNLDKGFNNILDIDDLTEFVITLCQNWTDSNSEILLLGNTENVKLNEIVSHIKELYHSSSVVRNVDAECKRYFTLDVTKAVKYGYHSKKIMSIIDDLYQIRKG